MTGRLPSSFNGRAASARPYVQSALPPRHRGPAWAEGTMSRRDAPSTGTLPMKRVIRVTSVVTLLLLTAMSLAAAEGPWVLWSKLTFRDGEGWLVNRAFDSADECRAAAAAALREAAGRGNTVVGGSVKTANGEITPVCLPDTVDPRGPKGK